MDKKDECHVRDTETKGSGKAMSVGSRIRDGLPRLSGTALKLIACVAMVCDHAAVALLAAGAPLYVVLRAVGRIAFPIFCLGVAEGARYTHDWKRYVGRLLLVGVVSELPGDAVISLGLGHWDPWAWQNVMWELALAVVAIRCCMVLDECVEQRSTVLPLMALVTVSIGAGAELLRFDYGFAGIVLAVLLWAARNHPVVRALVPVLPLYYELPWVLGGSGLIACYDGTRGRTTHPWLFYWFYPAHLAVLAVIGRLV